MAGVPATAGDATDYGATTSDRLGKSTVFGQKQSAQRLVEGLPIDQVIALLDKAGRIRLKSDSR